MADDLLPELHCHRCIYTWTPRRSPVRMCPRCKSKLWNRPLLRAVPTGTGLGIAEVMGAHRDAVLALIRRYGAKRVLVFGSVRQGRATGHSDIDLLVDSLPGASLLDQAHLETELARLLGRPVDVVEEDALPWSIRPQVLAEAIPL
jgi:predicted nucleotidyltransferase